MLRDPADIHHARQRVICIENTLGELGGLVYPGRPARAGTLAAEHDLRAAPRRRPALERRRRGGRDPAELVANVDSVSVCFSKGLGAPVGSAVVGDEELIARARRTASCSGGGMRQAGVIAAGALHAAAPPSQRVADDHRERGAWPRVWRARAG